MAIAEALAEEWPLLQSLQHCSVFLQNHQLKRPLFPDSGGGLGVLFLSLPWTKRVHVPGVKTLD